MTALVTIYLYRLVRLVFRACAVLYGIVVLGYHAYILLCLRANMSDKITLVNYSISGIKNTGIFHPVQC